MRQNNADEGSRFTPQDIETEADFVQYVRDLFPLFTESDVNKTLIYYPSTSAPVNENAAKFATSGDGYPTALNQSSFGTGQQQRANVCRLQPLYLYVSSADGSRTCTPRSHSSVRPTGWQRRSATGTGQATNTSTRSSRPFTGTTSHRTSGRVRTRCPRPSRLP